MDASVRHWYFHFYGVLVWLDSVLAHVFGNQCFLIFILFVIDWTVLSIPLKNIPHPTLLPRALSFRTIFTKYSGHLYFNER